MELAERLVEAHVGMAKALAIKVWKTAPHVLEREELISIGYFGLVQAGARWEAYCEEKGYSSEREDYFAVFAKRRINGAIYDHLRNCDYATRMQRGIIKRMNADEEVSDDERRNAEKASAPLSVEVEMERDQNELPRTIESVESSGETSRLLRAFVAAIRGLSKMDQTILALHYYSGIDLQDVSTMLGLVESRVSKHHTEALLRIHQAMKDAARDREG